MNILNLPFLIPKSNPNSWFGYHKLVHFINNISFLSIAVSFISIILIYEFSTHFVNVFNNTERGNSKNRQYNISSLPTFLGGKAIKTVSEKETLLTLYKEICSNWRTLADVRFKLLGFIPTFSLALFTGLLLKNNSSEGFPKIGKLIISVFSFLVVISLLVYERRNSELYDDLISRGRRIESELGIYTGQFRGRIRGHWLLSHDPAIVFIYLLVAALWLFAILAFWLKWF